MSRFLILANGFHFYFYIFNYSVHEKQVSTFDTQSTKIRHDLISCGFKVTDSYAIIKDVTLTALLEQQNYCTLLQDPKKYFNSVKLQR